MTSRNRWFTGIVVGVSIAYKLVEHIEFMRPAVTWLDKKIGGDTLIELLLTALVFYLLFSHGEKEDTDTEPAQPLAISNPVVSPTISPIIDASQHHHYPEPAKMESLPQPTPPRMRTLSIVGKRGRMAGLSVKVGNCFYEPEDNGKFKAVVAEFRNEPGEFSIMTWCNVRASIAFFDENGVEVADVGKALWMGGMYVLDMESHVTCKLIVAILADAWLSFNGDDTAVLPANTKRAKIVLQDDRYYTLPFVLDFDLNQETVGKLSSLTPPTQTGRQ